MSRPVIRVGVTGAAGLLGTHLRAYLLGVADMESVAAGRQTFADPATLSEFVQRCDVIVHLAGMNRGDEAEVARTNIELTRKLVTALDEAGTRPQVLFSSSTHIDRDTLYGASKRESAALLAAWAGRSGAVFTNLVLPGVFGEGGKPFYNSVVSTFCSQLAQGQTPQIQHDGAMEQLHSQTVARLIEAQIRGAQNGTVQTGEVRPAGERLNVSELLARLQDLAAVYAGNVFPDLRDPFSRDLFNTYRSYLVPQPRPLVRHSDERGSLFEALKGHSGGQSFYSTTHPGVTRGNHFHTRKVERFLVVGGQARIRLRHVFSDEVISFDVSGDAPAAVDIPTLHTHNISNTGSQPLTTLFWTNELFDPAAPDTVAQLVEMPGVAH